MDRDYADNGASEQDLIGWRDDEALYLIPDAAFKAVAGFCREAGEPLATRQQRTKKDLFEQGISETDAGRLTTTICLNGRTRRVLKLLIPKIEEVLGEDFPTRNHHFHHHYGDQSGDNIGD